MIPFDIQLQRLTQALKQCHDDKLWGKVTLQMVAGNIIELQITQTVKVQQDKLEPIVCVKQKDSSESLSEPLPRSPELSSQGRPKGVSDEHAVRR